MLESKRLTVLDLFCGAGGLSLGLPQEIFNVVGALDNWSPSIETYRAVHPNTDVRLADIYDFNDSLLSNSPPWQAGDIDLVVGGPPCQGFCGMNRHRSIHDRRNSLVEAFVQTVEILKPRFVCMENVTGLMSLGEGSYLNQLLETLHTLGYEADYRLLQAGYYGLPQNRWRFILFASLEGGIRKWPQPVHAFHRTAVHNVGEFTHKAIRLASNEPTLFFNPLPEITVWDAISDLPPIENGGCYEGPYTEPPRCHYQAILRQGSIQVRNHSAMQVRPLHVERFRHIPKGKANSGWLDLPDHLKPNNLKAFSDSSYDNRFGRLNWDGTFNAIMAKVEPYWGRVIHPEQDRLISARECARAQGFPDWVEFCGSLSDVFRQIGNAVPVPLSRAIGDAIARNLGFPVNAMENYINSYRAAVDSKHSPS